MGSTLPHGSRVRIAAVPRTALQPGDIVACINDGFLSAHRLVYHGREHGHPDYFITQGDGWILCDSPRHVATLVGVVESCCVDGTWVRPAPVATRTASDQWAAARHVALMSFCLRKSLRTARFVARRLLTVYTIRENVRIFLRRFA
ncbi:MAG: hypothetical protein ABIP81_00110 [Terriglobales bacterium]